VQLVDRQADFCYYPQFERHQGGLMLYLALNSIPTHIFTNSGVIAYRESTLTEVAEWIRSYGYRSCILDSDKAFVEVVEWYLNGETKIETIPEVTPLFELRDFVTFIMFSVGGLPPLDPGQTSYTEVQMEMAHVYYTVMDVYPKPQGFSIPEGRISDPLLAGPPRRRGPKQPRQTPRYEEAIEAESRRRSKPESQRQDVVEPATSFDQES